MNNKQERPNILFILAEDMCPNLGCYGDVDAITPTLDALAKRGMRYTEAYSVAPVCSAARTTIALGMYPQSVGAGNHRSYVKLPKPVKPFAVYMREAGYYTAIDKTDFNFEFAEETCEDCGWDRMLGENIFTDTYALCEESQKAWRERGDKPFFFQHTFAITHQSRYGHPSTPEAHRKEMIPRTRPEDYMDREKLTIPAYHPDNKATREIWGQYHECITAMDRMVAELLEKLKEDSLEDNTIILFAGDNGMGIPGGKAAMWNEGCHVPFIAYVPPKYKNIAYNYEAGSVNKNIMCFADIAPTILSFAGVSIPNYMQGQNLFGEDTKTEEYAFGYRNRIDSNYEFIRTVKKGKYLYIRNFYPHRGWRFSAYMENMAPDFTSEWKKSLRKNDDTLKYNFEYNRTNAYGLDYKPSEEFYDLEKDPAQLHNIAGNEDVKLVIDEYRSALYEFLKRTSDLGFIPEYELIQFAKDRNVLELANNEKEYPISLLISIADNVRTNQYSKNELFELLENENATVRYWAVEAIHNLNEYDCEIEKALWNKVKNEDSSMVIIAACETLLSKNSTKEVRDKVVSTLKEILKINNNVVLPIVVCDLIHHMDKEIPVFKDELKKAREIALTQRNQEQWRYTNATKDIAELITR